MISRRPGRPAKPGGSGGSAPRQRTLMISIMISGRVGGRRPGRPPGLPIRSYSAALNTLTCAYHLRESSVLNEKVESSLFGAKYAHPCSSLFGENRSYSAMYRSYSAKGSSLFGGDSSLFGSESSLFGKRAYSAKVIRYQAQIAELIRQCAKKEYILSFFVLLTHMSYLAYEQKDYEYVHDDN